MGDDDRRRKSSEDKAIALERIERLFQGAEKALATDPEMCRRNIRLARKVAMRYNIKLGPLKKAYCRKCYILLKPNINSRTRVDAARGIKTVTCLECGSVRRAMFGKRPLEK